MKGLRVTKTDKEIKFGLRGPGASWGWRRFPGAIIQGIFETGSGFHGDSALGEGFFDTVGEIFLLAGGWALVYHSVVFRHFPDIS